MKKFFSALLCLVLLLSACFSFAENAAETTDVVFPDLSGICSEELSAEATRLYNDFYLDASWPVLLYGTDDPSLLPVSGKHAFVVLGLQLVDGEMTDELKARCNAAAAAAKAFPESVLVCSGGATGENNPARRTEAGLMKSWLTKHCGIAAGRILTDEKAMTTAENALNTFEILRQQGIESITLVTSDYHQRRANLLYGSLAAFNRLFNGFDVTLIGSYACVTEKGSAPDPLDAMVALIQTEAILTEVSSGVAEAREMIANFASKGDQADALNAPLLARIRAFNPPAAACWEEIMNLWKELSKNPEVNGDVLPDGLPDTNELCIVALGYQLNPDGTMRPELVNRLKVVLSAAKKYPNAPIVCTGGPTAANQKDATEAGKMRDWLIAKGVSPERVYAEGDSLSTVQNAVFTLNLLSLYEPQVTQLALISSDYHIPTGILLFETRCILTAPDPSTRIRVVSNASCHGTAALSVSFQAAALSEIAGY